MQDGACAMGRARCKGRNGTGGVTSSTGFLPAGWRSEVAREIALGHALGRRHFMNFFLVFLFAGAAAPKRRS